ncbi:hypothetical protein TI05_05570 [Achromatium sp. WMS3]|nr:hypothetical protein TI05_05570 [Achromatium sp. WMS3]
MGITVVLISTNNAATHTQPMETTANINNKSWLSLDRIISLSLLGIIILLVIYNRHSSNLQNQKLEKLQKELDKTHKKTSESEEPNNQRSARPDKPLKATRNTVSSNQNKNVVPSNQKLKQPASYPTNKTSSRYRYPNANTMDDTIQLQGVASLDTATTVIDTATTIIDPAITIELQRGQKIKEILVVYNKMTKNLRPNDFKEFCQKHNAINVKSTNSDSSQEMALTLVDNQPCHEADFWAIPDVIDRHYLILPGATIILDCKALHLENANLLGKLFRGILTIVEHSSFEVFEPGCAEKRGSFFVITDLGKLGLPIQAIKY